MIYITDYIQSFEIEKKVIGQKLLTYKKDDNKKSKAKVLLVWHYELNESSLKNFPEAHTIVRYGVGVDNIDLNFCQSKGIKVFNNPDYGIDEVSDSAIAMILNLSRNITFYDKKSRHLFLNPNQKFPWQENTENSSLRLKDSSLGLIGVGRIGSAVALKMKNIIGEINFYDPYVSSGYEKVISANRFESLYSMLSKSDIVSLHTPLNEETSGMVNDAFIKKMRKGSILINTSRGGIIESLDCIYNGILSGNLGAVGLDVLPTEPPDKSLREKLLLSWANQNKISERVIINPHTSYYSPQSYEEMRHKAAEMSLEAMEGNLKRNRII